ncbi:MAG: hypothetical protein V1843_01185 [bacterium]
MNTRLTSSLYPLRAVETQLQMGKVRNAGNMLTHIAPDVAHDPNFHLLAGDIAYMQKDIPLATYRYSRVNHLSIPSIAVAANYNLGIISSDQAYFTKALEILNPLCPYNPSAAILHTALGTTLLKQGDEINARRHFNAAGGFPIDIYKEARQEKELVDSVLRQMTGSVPDEEFGLGAHKINLGDMTDQGIPKITLFRFASKQVETFLDYIIKADLATYKDFTCLGHVYNNFGNPLLSMRAFEKVADARQRFEQLKGLAQTMLEVPKYYPLVSTILEKAAKADPKDDSISAKRLDIYSYLAGKAMSKKDFIMALDLLEKIVKLNLKLKPAGQFSEILHDSTIWNMNAMLKQLGYPEIAQEYQ